MLSELIAHLDTLDLPAPVWRTALRLAQQANGYPAVVVSYAELRAIVGTESDDTARAHLAKLHKAGVLWFRRNGDISVTFYPIQADEVLITERSKRSTSDQNDQPAISTDPGARSPSDQNDQPAIKMINQRSDAAEADYIITTTTNVVVDNYNNKTLSSSSSSAPTEPDLSLTDNSNQNEPQQPAAPPTVQPDAVAEGYPDLVRLYENNIGLVTPIMSGTLKTALRTWPREWIERALEIAVRNEKRTWRYVEGILANWTREGFDNDRKPLSTAVAASGARGRAATDRRAPQPAAATKQWGPEWYFDPDEPPPVDAVA